MSIVIHPVGTKVAIDGLGSPMDDLNGLTGTVESYPSDMERLIFDGIPEDAHYVIVDTTGEKVGVEGQHLTALTQEVAA